MNTKEQKFVRTVWKHYQRPDRRILPWHRTTDSYRILVSELMLQQTQVDRVIPKYRSFLKKFPTLHALARAPLSAVLKEWQGLGYNRRAKNLHECAKIITEKYKGKVPTSYDELRGLPGVGLYTAGAIMAFAHNKSVPIIETNIRSAYLHHFFNEVCDIPDSEIVRYIERTLDAKNPREWYWALMGYGAHIKKKYGNPNTRSKHYIKQSTFKGSDRQIRGMILQLLGETKHSKPKLHKKLDFDIDRVNAQLERLFKEGMVVKNRNMYSLPE